MIECGVGHRKAGRVRELVYLSDAKLAQFVPTLTAVRRWPRFSVKTPVVEVSYEPGPDDDARRRKHFDRVVTQIERSARWFADDAVAAGDWVQFEAPLNHVLLDRRDRPPLLLFTDRPTVTDEHPTPDRLRLLLHGSAKHLLPVQRPPRVPALSDDADVTDFGGGDSAGSLWSSPSALRVLLDGMRARERPSADPGNPLLPLGDTVGTVLYAVDRRSAPETAAWQAGYARVTAAVRMPGGKRCVVASPLYVEHATAPN